MGTRIRSRSRMQRSATARSRATARVLGGRKPQRGRFASELQSARVKKGWNSGNRKPVWGWSRKGMQATLRPQMKNVYWAAGIYEGEGTVNSWASGGKKSGNVRVSVWQKDRWILIRLKAFFGGSVNKVREYKGHNLYAWTACGVHARGFLYTIFSELSPRRRKQIRKAFGK